MFDWQPLSTLPQNKAMHIQVKTPNGNVTSWRWLPYKKGSQWPYIGGRWQSATEYNFRNDNLPTVGEWKLNPVIRK